MITISRDKLVYSIREKDLQTIAKERTGRRLDEKEMHVAIKCINEGLSYDIDAIFRVAVDEALKNEET